VLLGAFALGACVSSGDDVASDETGPAATSGPTDPTDPTDPTNPATATTADGTATDPTTSEPMDTTVGPLDVGSGLPQVAMETSLGTMVIELDDEAAPITVENFLAYTDAGFYDGGDGLGATIFHRVIDGFVIQAGGLTEDLETKATMPPIVNESGNGLSNVRGSIAMARLPEPDTATSQFYFNLEDNLDLDRSGYAVFGRVVEGLEVMDAIAAVPVDGGDVPLRPVIILSVSMQ